MSEPPPPISPVDSLDQRPQDDNGNDTVPTEETQKVLEELDTVVTAPNSQENVVTPKQEFKEEKKTPPPQLSEWQLLLDRLRDSPHDPEGWNRLVDLAENSGTLEEIKATYDALLEVYPNTAQAQIAYIGHYADAQLFAEAQKLFRGALLASPAVELWKFYLTYVRRRNPGTEKRGVIRDAYEFALTRIGHDKDSGEIWMDYIQFLKAGEAATTWDEQQKMDALRKVYHRAVQIPLENVEQLWSELESFESNLNKITAKKFMADLSPSYMQARTVLRQLQRHLGLLFPPPPPSSSARQPLYLPSLPTFNPPERALVGAWKTYLKWEEGNPLELDESDKSILTQRIQSIYRKAVCRMRYYSEIWYMWYVWHSNIGTIDRMEAITVLKEGIKANPASYLLNFAYAEALELKGDKEGVAATYEKLIDILRTNLEDLESRINSANSSFEASDGASLVPNGDQIATNGEPGSQSTNSSFDSQGSNEKPTKSKELAERRKEYGLAWNMYMRAARRMDNQAAARVVFGKCRKDRWVPWEVYESSALMEYHICNSKSVAVRIFEKGLELFADEVEFVLRYLGFLISLNDDQNARALFERVIPTFSPQAARPIWERWARYEYQYGDLASALRLEKRISEVFSSDPPIKRFAQRHIYLGTDAIAAQDLGFALAKQTGSGQTTGNSLARTETQQSLTNSTGGGGSNKRPASPEYRKRDDRPSADHGPAHKRARPMSPVRERDRDRWEGPPRRRGSPSYDRGERDRDGPPRRIEREQPEEKPVAIPPVISWFVGQLPTPAAFNGPIFRTDDLMMLFRNAVIPSARPRSPPAPPPRAESSTSRSWVITKRAVDQNLRLAGDLVSNCSVFAGVLESVSPERRVSDVPLMDPSSDNDIETAPPPAFSSLRSKFEQLGVDKSSTPSGKGFLGTRSPGPSSPRPREVSLGKPPPRISELAATASGMDSRLGIKRPPPPPPRTPHSTPSTAAKSPLHRPVPTPTPSPLFGQQALPGPLPRKLGEEALAVPPAGAVAALKSRFGHSPGSSPPRVSSPISTSKSAGLVYDGPQDGDLLGLHSPPIPPRHQTSTESLLKSRRLSAPLNQPLLNIDQMLEAAQDGKTDLFSEDSDSDSPGIASPPLPPRRIRPAATTINQSYQSDFSSSSSLSLMSTDSDVMESDVHATPKRPVVNIPPVPPRPMVHRQASYEPPTPGSTAPALPVRRGTAAVVEEVKSPLSPAPRLPQRPHTVKPLVQSANTSRASLLSNHPPPPTRTIGLGEKLPPPRRSTWGSSDEEDAAEDEPADMLPDASRSSRRPPVLDCFNFNEVSIPIQAHNGIAAVSGATVVVASHHHVTVYDLNLSRTPVAQWESKQLQIQNSKITAIEFRSSVRATDIGSFVWIGSKEGSLFEMEIHSGMLTASRPGIHGPHHISHIFRRGRTMLTMDQTSKIYIWTPDDDNDVSLNGPMKTLRIGEHPEFVRVMGGLLWTSTRSDMGSTHSKSIPLIKVFDLDAPSGVSRAVAPKDQPVGAVTSGAMLPFSPQNIYLGHENGFITVWQIGSDKLPYCTEVVKVAANGIVSLEGVADRIWAGGRMGAITVYDVSSQPWTVTNQWTAHKQAPTSHLFVDPHSIEKLGRLSVVSIGKDQQLRLWDGFLSSDWIDMELTKREQSFSTFRSLKVLIVSWNIDAATPDALSRDSINSKFLFDVLSSVNSPDIVSFGFQETVDLESKRAQAANAMKKKLKPSFDEGKVGGHLNPEHRVWQQKFESIIRQIMPHDAPYSTIQTDGMVGLFSCVFVKRAERANVKDLAMATVKRGFRGNYGNKGAIFARFTVDDSSFCIVNCHLAAGQGHVRQRNGDAAAIIERSELFEVAAAIDDPLAYVGGGDGTMVLDHEVVFFHGDLNYRIEGTRENVVAQVKAGDYAKLIGHDQLTKEMKINRGFRLRMFNEGPLNFAPTYKYDRRSTEYDSSEKRRIPAWCDRILWRAHVPDRVHQLEYRRWEADISDHRPISAVFDVTVKSVNQDNRAIVRVEVAETWQKHQEKLLHAARDFYVGQMLL
ncbi:hypothetical protein HWV62_10883 [Athelia sp. TMB]|nr:hypothetical protein HWV62_10883 [Athelia sp. TMB]